DGRAESLRPPLISQRQVSLRGIPSSPGGVVGVEVVGLAGEDSEPPVGQRGGGCLGRVAQERRAVLGGGPQGPGGGGGGRFGGQGQVADDGGVVGECVGDRLQGGAERGVAQLGD